MLGGMFYNCQVQHLLADGTNAAAAAGATAVTSDYIDTQNFNEIVIMGILGAMAASSTCDFKLTGCATSGGTYVDLEGSALGQAVVATDADCIFMWDIKRLIGGYRYIKVVCTRAVGNVTIQGIVAMKWANTKNPRTQVAGTKQFVVSQAGIKFLYDLKNGTA